MHSVKLTNSEALFDSSYIPEIKVWVDGVLTAPSSATLSMYWSNGDEKVTDRACTINGTTKAITATFTAAERYTDTDEDYRLLLKYVISGTTYQANFLFDDCLTPLNCSVVDADLLKYSPELADNRWNNETTFSKIIERAFDDIRRRLKEKGRRASLMVDGQQINDLVVTHTLELIYFDFAKADNDIWWIKYMKMAERFQAEFDNLHLKYDEDEGGEVDGTETFSTSSLVR
jgi:hypothetical protein